VCPEAEGRTAGRTSGRLGPPTVRPPAPPTRTVPSEGSAIVLHMNRPNVLQTKTALWLVCVKRAGIRGGLVVEFVDDWRDCVTAHGGPTSIQGYAKWTRRYSHRTAYYRLALFRKTFPELGPEGTPEGLLGPLLERLAQEEE
jgi:hypothetical protein